MSKRKNTRPALVQNCDRTDDHPKHPWRPDGVLWAEGVFWHCRGRDNTQIAQWARDTQRAVRKSRKKS